MKPLYTIYASFLCCFFLSGSCVAAPSSSLTVFKMKTVPAPPALVVLQQKEDGSNQILDKVPEEYPAVVPYFLNYLQKNIEEFSDATQARKTSAIVITYTYPDNLEINFLSDKREKIVKKISEDQKLHDLRIRSAILMFSFTKNGTGAISNNAIVGFQLFPEGVDYRSMNIVPDYQLVQGSWILTWERTIQIVTQSHFVADIRVAETLRITLREILFIHEISIVLSDGSVIVVQVTDWLYFNLPPKIINTIIPKRIFCRCVSVLPSPASPIGNNTAVRIPCGQPFYRSQSQTCSELGRVLYPSCYQCFDTGLGSTSN